jgi:hypothetical protein
MTFRKEEENFHRSYKGYGCLFDTLKIFKLINKYGYPEASFVYILSYTSLIFDVIPSILPRFFGSKWIKLPLNSGTIASLAFFEACKSFDACKSRIHPKATAITSNMP